MNLNSGAKVGLEIVEIKSDDMSGVLKAYSLLNDLIDCGSLEDKISFKKTVSHDTDICVVPILICALDDNQIQGVILAAYLKDLNMGMMLYSGVREQFRHKGVYTAMRTTIISKLNIIAIQRRGSRIKYLLTEIPTENRLLDNYIKSFGAFIAPCEYEQPPVQGLRPRNTNLILAPIGNNAKPTLSEIGTVIKNIFFHIYRIPDVMENQCFMRIIASMGVENV